MLPNFPLNLQISRPFQDLPNKSLVSQSKKRPEQNSRISRTCTNPDFSGQLQIQLLIRVEKDLNLVPLTLVHAASKSKVSFARVVTKGSHVGHLLWDIKPGLNKDEFLRVGYHERFLQRLLEPNESEKSSTTRKI